MSTVIPSRLDIKNTLQKIAKDSGYEGATIDLLISILSTGYYESILRSLLLLRESNQETAINYNSLLNIAASKMYSAYRGRNHKGLLLAKSEKVKIIKRGDLLYESEDFNIYSEGNIYKFESNQNNELDLSITDYQLPTQIVVEAGDNYDSLVNETIGYTIIPVVFCKKYYEETSFNRAPSLHVDFDINNLSEDIQLQIYKNMNSQGSGVRYSDSYLLNRTKDFTEFIKNEESLLKGDTVGSIFTSIFDLTLPGSGLRIYTNNSQYSDANLVLSAFDFLDTAYIDEFTSIYDNNENPTVNQITSNLKFDLSSESILLFNQLQVKNFIEANSTNIGIAAYLNAYLSATEFFNFPIKDRQSFEDLMTSVTYQIRSNYIIRSYSDLNEVIKSYFKFRSNDPKIIKDIKITVNSGNENPGLEVFYVFDSTQTSTDLTEQDAEEFLNEKGNYFFLPENHQLTFTKGSPINIRISINAKFTTAFDDTELINEINNKWGYKFDIKVEAYEIQSYITKLDSIESLISCTFNSSTLNSNNNSELPILGENNYYIFSYDTNS